MKPKYNLVNHYRRLLTKAIREVNSTRCRQQFDATPPELVAAALTAGLSSNPPMPRTLRDAVTALKRAEAYWYLQYTKHETPNH